MSKKINISIFWDFWQIEFLDKNSTFWIVWFYQQNYFFPACDNQGENCRVLCKLKNLMFEWHFLLLSERQWNFLHHILTYCWVKVLSHKKMKKIKKKQLAISSLSSSQITASNCRAVYMTPSPYDYYLDDLIKLFWMIFSANSHLMHSESENCFTIVYGITVVQWNTFHRMINYFFWPR